MVDQSSVAIKEYLKRKRESVVIDLVIRNYNKANFYIALLYDLKTMKYKVLFIPLDIVDSDIDYYACYQFININLVDYILETLEENIEDFKDKNRSDKLNKMIDSYYIEINAYLGNKEYKFKATQYIPEEWKFLFEVIVILFEHLPNIVSELCEELLKVLNKQDSFIPYQISTDFDLYNDDINKIISYSDKIFLNDLSYLEKVNDKYFGIISNHIVIVEYTGRKILNLYCSCDEYDDYFYVVIEAIKKEKFKKFTKLAVVDDKRQFELEKIVAKYYLCYGVLNNSFRVIHGCSEKLLPISMYEDGLIKIIEDENNILEEIKKDQ